MFYHWTAAFQYEVQHFFYCFFLIQKIAIATECLHNFYNYKRDDFFVSFCPFWNDFDLYWHILSDLAFFQM